MAEDHWYGFEPGELRLQSHRSGSDVSVRVTHEPTGHTASASSQEEGTISIYRLRRAALAELRETVDA